MGAMYLPSSLYFSLHATLASRVHDRAAGPPASLRVVYALVAPRKSIVIAVAAATTAVVAPRLGVAGPKFQATPVLSQTDTPGAPLPLGPHAILPPAVGNDVVL